MHVWKFAISEEFSDFRRVWTRQSEISLREHSEEPASLSYGQLIYASIVHEAQRASRIHCWFNGKQRRPHCGADTQLARCSVSAWAWQVNAVLKRERLVDGLSLQAKRDVKAHEVGNHERHDDGIIARHFENHDHGCE